jgi:hypothetical protein
VVILSGVFEEFDGATAAAVWEHLKAKAKDASITIKEIT